MRSKVIINGLSDTFLKRLESFEKNVDFTLVDMKFAPEINRPDDYIIGGPFHGSRVKPSRVPSSQYDETFGNLLAKCDMETFIQESNLYGRNYDMQCLLERLLHRSQHTFLKAAYLVKEYPHLELHRNMMFEAGESGRVEAMRFLLNKSDIDPKLAFVSVLWNGHTEVLKLLLDDPRIDPSANNNYAIGISSKRAHIESVKLLMNDPRVDPSADNNFAIRHAASDGHFEVVKLLLTDARVDPSAQSNDAIRHAASNGRTEVVELLLSDTRVDPSTRYNEATRLASSRGYTEIVKLLLKDPRVDPSAMDNEAIKLALQRRHNQIVGLLRGDKRVETLMESE